jgi:hypothetical protein
MLWLGFPDTLKRVLKPLLRFVAFEVPRHFAELFDLRLLGWRPVHDTRIYHLVRRIREQGSNLFEFLWWRTCSFR